MALVLLCSYTKIPKAGTFIKNRHVFLIVVNAEEPKIKDLSGFWSTSDLSLIHLVLSSHPEFELVGYMR